MIMQIPPQNGFYLLGIFWAGRFLSGCFGSKDWLAGWFLRGCLGQTIISFCLRTLLRFQMPHRRWSGWFWVFVLCCVRLSPDTPPVFQSTCRTLPQSAAELPECLKSFRNFDQLSFVPKSSLYGFTSPNQPDKWMVIKKIGKGGPEFGKFFFLQSQWTKIRGIRLIRPSSFCICSRYW